MKLKAAVILLKENLISTSDEWYHTFRAAPLITALFLFFIGSGTVAAQDATASVDSGKIQVFFRKGYSTFDPSYKNNGTRIRNFIEQIEQWRNRNSLHTDFLKIHGAASPETCVAPPQLHNGSFIVTRFRIHDHRYRCKLERVTLYGGSIPDAV